MRTLSRPMFNMGGPIKEGFMHGIREHRQGYADRGVVKQITELVLKKPYTDRSKIKNYQKPSVPNGKTYKTYCGT